MNRARIVGVAVYCRPARGCSGTAALTIRGDADAPPVGRASFRLAGDDTSHVSIRVSSQLLKLIREEHGVATTFVAVVGRRKFSQTVEIKIL